MRTITLTLAYDGTRYIGWQRQAEGTSIQGLLEAALARIDDRPIAVAGAGRTDAGVHALGQVASFELAHPLPLDALARAVNARLPEDVRVRSAEERPAGFHARFSAIGKTYRYRLRTGPHEDPFDCRFAWHVPQRLVVPEMARALEAIEGRHDFCAFQAAGSDVKTTVRAVTHAGLRPVVAGPGWPFVPPDAAGGLLEVEISADGFLRHMVRTIVGTLVEIGRGRRPASDMARVIGSRDRAQAGPTAPPHGLFLVGVEY